MEILYSIFLLGIYASGFFLSLGILYFINILGGKVKSLLVLWTEIIFLSLFWPLGILKIIIKK